MILKITLTFITVTENVEKRLYGMWHQVSGIKRKQRKSSSLPGYFLKPSFLASESDMKHISFIVIIPHSTHNRLQTIECNYTTVSPDGRPILSPCPYSEKNRYINILLSSYHGCTQRRLAFHSFLLR